MGPTNEIERALAAPYTRIFTKEEDAGYSAWVLELQGVNAAAETIEEANRDLEAAMADWIAFELEAGHEIPAPIDPDTYSGRLTFRIPPSVHHQAALRAQIEGVSLNRLLSDAVSQYIAAPGPREAGARYGAPPTATRGRRTSARLREGGPAAD